MSKQTVKAVNPKHQPTVERFLSANAVYDALVDIEKEETPRGQKAYEKALNLWSKLPKTEQNNIERALPVVKGCY